MESGIIAFIFAIIMIVTHIIKSIKENAEVAKRQQQEEADEVIVIRPNKSIKQIQKQNKQGQRQKGLQSVFEDKPSEIAQKKALVKKLAPQGEGHRFVADPGTLDTSHIVSSSIDPTVKPELGSITGIYDQDAAMGTTRRTAPTIELNLLESLKRPEGICQAVILAEIMNRPAWIDAPQ